MSMPFKPGDIIRYDSGGALRQYDGIIGVCIEAMPDDGRIKLRPLFTPDSAAYPASHDWYSFSKIENMKVLDA